MAMVKCRECGTDVSTNAAACPKCGSKKFRPSSGVGTLLAIIGGAIVVVAVANNSSRPGAPIPARPAPLAAPAQPTAPPPAPSPAPPTAVAKVPSQPPAHISAWRYTDHQDAMGKGVTRFAEVTSSNTLTFDFPYQGAQHATLTLRNHPRSGRAAMLMIERGQFLCGIYECRITVRFDDGAAQSYSAGPPDDHSTTVLFVNNAGRLIAGIKKAKRLRIEATFYQHGSQMMEFDVEGYDDTWLAKGK